MRSAANSTLPITPTTTLSLLLIRAIELTTREDPRRIRLSRSCICEQPANRIMEYIFFFHIPLKIYGYLAQCVARAARLTLYAGGIATLSTIGRVFAFGTIFPS